MASSAAPLVWIDLEMSGLEPAEHHILEIAVIITDGELDNPIEGPGLIVHQPDAVLEAMDSWCTEHHGASGLTQAVKDSTISLAQAQAQVLDFIREHCPEGKSPLCGNTIGQDRRFLAAYMPAIEAYLHYRSIDVSTIKELARRWYPGVAAPAKAESHRALDDIRESIEELKFYRRTLFVQATPAPPEGSEGA